MKNKNKKREEKWRKIGKIRLVMERVLSVGVLGIL